MQYFSEKNRQVISLRMIILSILLCLSLSYTSPQKCNSTNQYYNILSLDCNNCPSNTQPAGDKTFCNCSSLYYPNWNAIGFNYNQSCQRFALNTTFYIKTTQILSMYNQAGTLDPSPITCSSNAEPSKNRDQCINCGIGSVYNAVLKACQCNNGFIKIGKTCYQNRQTQWSRIFSPNDVQNHLAQEKVMIGCVQQQLSQQCNLLLNKCAKAEYLATNYFCSLLFTLLASNNSRLPLYKFSSQLTDSIGIYASSIYGINTTQIKNQLQIIVVQYNLEGQIQTISPINKQLFECQITQEDVVKFSSFGLNLDKKCTQKRSFNQQMYYDFYVKTSNSKYAQIPIFTNGGYYKRFSPSVSKSPYSIQLQFISVPPLQVPILKYDKSSSSMISTSSRSSTILQSPITIFIIYNVFIFICFVLIFYRYIQYNPSQQMNDPYFLCRGAVTLFFKICYTWSYGFWIWSFGYSVYMFVFYKFQQTIFLILPDISRQAEYYKLFITVFYIQLVFVFITVFKVIYDKSQVDYFMIDWQKQKNTSKNKALKQIKQVSVWRKILIVNQLYRLSIKQNIDVYLVTLFSLLFLKGLEWMNLSYSLPNTSNLTQMSSTSTSENFILSYCIITFVFFIIGAVKFILRILVRIWYPLSSQDFVDLCAVSNISIFIFNQALHGYYIHGVNPIGQSEGSLNYIESIFEKQAKSFGKSRGFHLLDPQVCQTFQVVFPPHIRLAFQTKYKSAYMQKLIPYSYQGQSIISNAIPDDLSKQDYDQLQKISLNMVENFKIYLESIKSSLMNLREQALWQKIISCPLSGLNYQTTPIFFKDKWNSFTNSFLSGHQFLLFFNYINFVNVFYIATKSIYFAVFIAIIVNEIVFKIPAKFLLKRNISKNTLIDEKFFN